MLWSAAHCVQLAAASAPQKHLRVIGSLLDTRAPHPHILLCRYGYSYGCAAADVWHLVHHTAMLYPGYEVLGKPGAAGLLVGG